MIYKRCTRCGTRLEYNTICSCKSKYKTNSDSYKDDKEKRNFINQRLGKIQQILLKISLTI